MGDDHYRNLGVDPAASHAELRSAYLKLARENHPDLSTPERRPMAERRMQQINEAWSVLGTERTRVVYDRGRGGNENVGAPTGSTNGTRRGRTHFEAYDNDPVVRNDVDLDPTPFTSSGTVPRWVSLMPIAMLVFSFPVFGFGLIVAASGLIALGLMMFALGGVGFLLLPLVVMSRAERDPLL